MKHQMMLQAARLLLILSRLLRNGGRKRKGASSPNTKPEPSAILPEHQYRRLLWYLTPPTIVATPALVPPGSHHLSDETHDVHHQLRSTSQLSRAGKRCPIILIAALAPRLTTTVRTTIVRLAPPGLLLP
ncbi:hypothetical protein U1Q18_010671 [Sarracenia purpurea var. burkii]